MQADTRAEIDEPDAKRARDSPFEQFRVGGGRGGGGGASSASSASSAAANAAASTTTNPTALSQASESTSAEEQVAAMRAELEAVKNQLAESQQTNAIARTIEETGEIYFELSKKRRVTVSVFRNKPMVSIREYYEKDGKTLPGKKGISLPKDQWGKLKELMVNIDDAIEAISN